MREMNACTYLRAGEALQRRIDQHVPQRPATLRRRRRRLAADVAVAAAATWRARQWINRWDAVFDRERQADARERRRDRPDALQEKKRKEKV
eukprot:COSAG06_NODE_40861_length_397_cov_3.526846_1_plen_91_part_10